MDKIKAFANQYNISLTIVGTAVVLSTMFGQCSYDYSSGTVTGTVETTEVVEAVKAVEDVSVVDE